MKKIVIAALIASAAAAGAWYWHSYDPRYYTASELEHAAYPLALVHVDPMPMVNGVEYFGKIRFDLYIGTNGRVERLEMIESTMPARVADDVVKAFTTARWQPGRMKDGREVKSVKRVEVNYEVPKSRELKPMAPDS